MKLTPFIPFEPISTTDLPKGDEWIAQVKWDGVRILTYFDRKEVELFNRKTNKRTFHYPEITEHIHEFFTGTSVILDGEVIALDSSGKPSFHEVMRRDGLRKMERVKIIKDEVPIYYMIFDIVYYNGKWVHNLPLKERLSILEKCIIPTMNVQVVPAQKDTFALWNIAKEYGLEGIVCKNINSPYLIASKNDNWKKVKNYQDVIAVIAGVTYRAGIINSLLLGLYDRKGQLWYIGHCGTGKLTNQDWKNITENTEPFKSDKKPFYNNPVRMKDVQWIIPEITVKVQFIEWPVGKTLRQPSIQAISDKPAEECFLPAEEDNFQKGNKKSTLDIRTIEITHPEKPLWKNPVIIKKDYIHFLEKIFPYISPFLKNRLLTVIRYPHGMFGEPFYQKNCPDYAPAFIQTVESDGIHYIICNDEETFLWLGNQLAFEFHIPFQQYTGKCPSEIVIDLDPPSKDAFHLAIKAAILIKEVLDSLKLIGFIKTSGNKGLQVYIPLPDEMYSYEETRLFTSFLAQYLITKEPESFTIERMKKNRKNRLYVDYIQFAEGKTIIAPYSPRGNPRATVATPLYWEEVHEDLTIDSFQIPMMVERIQNNGDPFTHYMKAKKEQQFDPVLHFLKNKLY